ncbi:NUDIX domain-containing protein [Patescibacteria group bacterium]|nr:NUDIX domain-containing protein [Patescibacteria group bacterium]
MTEEVQRYTVIPRVLVFVFKNNKLMMMKYSGKGGHQTQEKVDRKDIYNPIGGHIEDGESPIDCATKEAMEEAGIKLLNPKISGVINVSGFAGKNIMNFIVSGTTEDEPIKETLEGTMEWVDSKAIDGLKVFPDLKPIMDKLMSLKEGQMFTGVIEFDGKFGLRKIELKTN